MLSNLQPITEMQNEEKKKKEKKRKDEQTNGNVTMLQTLQSAATAAAQINDLCWFI